MRNRRFTTSCLEMRINVDKISIDKLVVFGNHGVFEAENMLGQKFTVSVVVYTDTRKAGLTDDRRVP